MIILNTLCLLLAGKNSNWLPQIFPVLHKISYYDGKGSLTSWWLTSSLIHCLFRAIQSVWIKFSGLEPSELCHSSKWSISSPKSEIELNFCLQTSCLLNFVFEKFDSLFTFFCAHCVVCAHGHRRFLMNTHCSLDVTFYIFRLNCNY